MWVSFFVVQIFIKREVYKMGIAELLTIVFIVLKLTGVIAWSWWLVLLPILIAVGIYVVWLIVLLIMLYVANRKLKKW